ncbi:nuclear transport factor 2 family protein [uncultured Propionibacterium sp.]|uniref:nuclear transport factor 2 family protein n=1 Tax=uncultured Propionibacterium sp. TaxID=218066 RepID=UPI00292F6C2D|nr:nuclear transport factor 2 family protein [uncultured Propionibacterium sp.]
MTLEQLEAKDAIREVIDRFSNLECDVAAQSALFTTDARVEVYTDGARTMDIRGRDELIQRFGAFTGGVKSSYHMNGQQVITLNDDGTATDEHYCRAVLVSSGEDGDRLSDNCIRYTDTLVQQEGAWLIAHREQHFVLSETRPRNT